MKAQQINTISKMFPELKSERMAWFIELSNRDVDKPSEVLFAEFHGSKVSDVRSLRRYVNEALVSIGSPASVEIVRAGWLPVSGGGAIAQEELQNRYHASLAAKKQTSIEDGSFAVLSEKSKDCFKYFGTQAKIRTPCEISFPKAITVGNWVSLGRYGKIVMLPSEAFGDDCGALANIHYPELSKAYDFSSQTHNRPADLIFGDGTTLGDRYFIICTKNIEFGKHVMTASDLFVSDCHHQYENVELPPVLLPPTKGSSVCIGDHVWIGIRCSVLEGVSIGRHAVIGAHSVVKDDVPPYSLAVGAPARICRNFSPNQPTHDSV